MNEPQMYTCFRSPDDPVELHVHRAADDLHIGSMRIVADDEATFHAVTREHMITMVIQFEEENLRG